VQGYCLNREVVEFVPTVIAWEGGGMALMSLALEVQDEGIEGRMVVGEAVEEEDLRSSHGSRRPVQ